ncbi:hypothetical protein [Salinispora cortesiana]|nr:hypothetical protein [Salinispora cortesiana]
MTAQPGGRLPLVGRAVGVAQVGYPPTIDEHALRVVLLAALARIRAS